MKLTNPKLLLAPPYSLSDKTILACKNTFPNSDLIICTQLIQVSPELCKHLNVFYNSLTRKYSRSVALYDKTTEYPNNYFDYFDDNYKEFYLWNIEHNTNLNFIACNNIDLDINKDFVVYNRSCDYAHKYGFYLLYDFNQMQVGELPSANLTKISFNDETGQAKRNFALFAYNWKEDKLNCLASKALLGVNSSLINKNLYIVIPQIDWATIHIKQKDLWDKKMYDEAILAEMGLKWAENAIVKD